MNEHWIVAVFTLTDDLLTASAHATHPLAGVSDAEVLTVALVAAAYFQNHHERALWVMQRLGYLSGTLSTSRFNRRLHRLSAWLDALLQAVTAVAAQAELFIIDTLPLPVCRRVRASQCRKVRGSPFYGYCAATEQKFFGWRLHIIYTLDGLPAAFDLLPARLHDLSAVHELTANFSPGARVLADKGYVSQADAQSILAATGVQLVASRKKGMPRLSWADEYDLRHFRIRAESYHSQLVNMGVQRLRARTHAGFETKVLASLLALAFSHLN